MQETTSETPTNGLPALRRPASWFTPRGRMSRKAFWIFYGIAVSVAFVMTVTLSMAVSLFPALGATAAPIAMLVIMLAATWTITAAMVRRLRDCGLHWSIVALSMMSLFATTLIFQVEMATFALNKANGTHQMWLSQRFPYLEISGLVFLCFAAALFYGLTRKGRGG